MPAVSYSWRGLVNEARLYARWCLNSGKKWLLL
jgi:hypothetical protein